ncbi:MAG: hypothetical protein U9Q81_06400 [Pseudomonadota bacterium]|nr:hypothetical protein [Pseudomonadota bacterium]
MIDTFHPEPLLMGPFGGLALFLFGMEQLANGLKAAAGDSLKTLMERLVPERPEPEPERIIVRPKFLDKELLSTPSLALERTRLEIGRLGGIFIGMLKALPEAVEVPA